MEISLVFTSEGVWEMVSVGALEEPAQRPLSAALLAGHPEASFVLV